MLIGTTPSDSDSTKEETSVGTLSLVYCEGGSGSWFLILRVPLAILLKEEASTNSDEPTSTTLGLSSSSDASVEVFSSSFELLMTLSRLHSGLE